MYLGHVEANEELRFGKVLLELQLHDAVEVLEVVPPDELVVREEQPSKDQRERYTEREKRE
jgi:hypothetical protein